MLPVKGLGFEGVHYVLSLDRIVPEVIQKLREHNNFSLQRQEWDALHVENVVDTKYFKDLEGELLGSFGNVGNALDGLVVQSENYRALSVLLPNFRERVSVVYIDPPYNTGSARFVYNDRFSPSEWLAMLNDRLRLGRELLSEEGAIFVNIGDTCRPGWRFSAMARLQLLLNDIFGESNYVATFVRKTKISPQISTKHIANAHDYILFYAKNINAIRISRKPYKAWGVKHKDEHYNERGYFRLHHMTHEWGVGRSSSMHYPLAINKGQIIEVFDGKEFCKVPAPEDIIIYPGGSPDKLSWQFDWSLPKVKWGIENDFIVFRKIGGRWKVYRKAYELVDSENKPREGKGLPYDTLILDYVNSTGTLEIKDIFGGLVFDFPKPSGLIKYLLQMLPNSKGIVLDFFAGTGSTGHAVLKLNQEDGGRRKFILVDKEAGIIVQRLKKLAYSFNWKGGKPKDNKGPGIFFAYSEGLPA